ncbi:MAG: Mu transposase C-terminal domain-containing protein [Cyanobacteria bacterium P01_H01_bin.15]
MEAIGSASQRLECFSTAEELVSDSCEAELSTRLFETDPSQILMDCANAPTLRYRLIEWLSSSPNRRVKGARKRQVAATLSISTRQVERLLNAYYGDRLDENGGVERSDKGTHQRLGDYWPAYIREVYEKSQKENHPLKPADVVREVKRHAIVDLGHEAGDYPHPATVYRILKPLVEQQKRRKKIRNPGSGSWLAVETRAGKILKADFSNQIVQCDHTKLDIRIVDESGDVLSWRPWLTTVIDTFSSGLLGYHLWHKQPGTHEVALTLRHAALPKTYPSDYGLEKTWDICGLPLQYFFTDGGKDLARSNHIKTIGQILGFACEIRSRPIQGGIVERLFKTINTQLLDQQPGYQRNRATKEDIAKAEKAACLRLEDVDKLLTSYFCDDYNHQPYPKDPRETRFERWLRGMGSKLPEPLKERELDICLMKEEQRVVQAHGSVYFQNLTYRCEGLRSRRGEYVTLQYDPDNILRLYIYEQRVGDKSGSFIGYAHAINMDSQVLSLDEVKRLNKEKSSARRSHSNYDALLAQGKRKALVETKKQAKKERQRTEQSKLRKNAKKTLTEVENGQKRSPPLSGKGESLGLLVEGIGPSQVPPQTTTPLSPVSEPVASPVVQSEERHRLSNPKDKRLKKIW